MVGDVVLRRICSCRGIPGQLAVRGQDVGDGKAAVIDEVAAVVVLCRAVLGDRQLVAVCIVDVGHGARRALLDGPWQLQVVVCQRQAPQAVGLHRAVGVVGIRLLRAAHRHLPQPVRAAGIGVGQRLGTEFLSHSNMHNVFILKQVIRRRLRYCRTSFIILWAVQKQSYSLFFFCNEESHHF